MKRYQVNADELTYLANMLQYLSTKDNELSEEGSAQIKEVLNRVESRPVLETIIDTKIFEKLEDFGDLKDD